MRFLAVKLPVLPRFLLTTAFLANSLAAGEVPFSPPQPIVGDTRTELINLNCAVGLTGNGRPDVVASMLRFGRQYLFVWENDPPLQEHFDSILESLKPQTCGQQIKFSAAPLSSGFKHSTERGAGGEGEHGAERFMKLKADIGLRRASLAQAPEVFATSVADINLDGRLDVAYGGLHWVGWTGTRGGGCLIDLIGHRGVAAADIDGDGDIDAAGSDGADLSWYANPGPPSETAWTVHRVTGFDHWWVQVAAGDVDRDGDPDLVTVARSPDSYQLALWRNLGAGTSWSQQLLDTTLWSANDQPTLVDLDKDGDLDLVAAQEPGLRWWENRDGQGNVWDSHAIVSGEIGTPKVLDLDNDGDFDVLAGFGSDSPTVKWWEQRAETGSLIWLPHQLTPDDHNVQRVLWEDFDSDGDLDCVYQTDDPNFYHGNVLYLRENLTLHRTAAFPVQRTVETAFGGPEAVMAGDVDKDGDPDILAAGFDTDELLWFENLGGDPPTWGEHLLAAGVEGIVALVTGDFDRDGDIDVAATSVNEGPLRWWENRVGDGSVWRAHAGSATLLAVRSICAGDLDGDGDFDLASEARLRPTPRFNFMQRRAPFPLSFPAPRSVESLKSEGREAAENLTG
jgi:hypothetical protein